jgi:hypothetical protein
MFERLREKAGFLDETICRISEFLVELYFSMLSSNFCQKGGEAKLLK